MNSPVAMNSRFAVLLAELRERFPGKYDTAEVVRFLKARGVEREGIVELCTELSREREGDALQQRSAGVLFRMEGPEERGRFTPDAWGHLTVLSMRGQLPGTEFEVAMERLLAHHHDGRISLADVRDVLSDLIVQDDDNGAPPDAATPH